MNDKEFDQLIEGVDVIQALIWFCIIVGLIDLTIYTITGFSVIDWILGALNIL